MALVRANHQARFNQDSNCSSSSLFGAGSNLVVRPPSNLDLISSGGGGGNDQRRWLYDENLLLFATEHDPAGAKANLQTASSPLSESQGRVASGARSALRQRPRNGGAEKRARSAAPMGRFVSLYPAPASHYGSLANASATANGGAAAASSPSAPYAFHVPASWQRARQTPSPTQRNQPQAARYGYLARDAPKHQAPPVAKFNRSLRSRTIEHLPSMVQVSVGDTQANRKRAENSLQQDERLELGPNALLASAGRLQASAEQPSLTQARHTIQCPADAPNRCQDNPFKPGTELSWQADLMVRLIKRGYPIEHLSGLLEAAKGARQRRSELNASQSCERLASHKQQQRPAASRQGQESRRLHSVSQTNLKTLPSPGSGGAHSKVAAPLPGPTLDECRRLWASSLPRARSVPRSLQAAGEQGGPLAGRREDADSLDRLILDFERETSHLFDEPAESLPSDQLGGPQLAPSKEQPNGRRLVEKLASGAKQARPPVPVPPQQQKQQVVAQRGAPKGLVGPPNARHQASGRKRRKSDSDLLQSKPTRRKCCLVQ